MKKTKIKSIGTTQAKTSVEPSPNIQQKCKYCEHQWITNSKYKFVTCPNCLRKVEVIK